MRKKVFDKLFVADDCILADNFNWLETTALMPLYVKRGWGTAYGVLCTYNKSNNST